MKAEHSPLLRRKHTENLELLITFHQVPWFVLFYYFFLLMFGDGNWRQAEAWIVLLAGAV